MDLTGANLAGASLRFTDLTGANIAGADLTGAGLASAIITLSQFEYLLTQTLYGLEEMDVVHTEKPQDTIQLTPAEAIAETAEINRTWSQEKAVELTLGLLQEFGYFFDIEMSTEPAGELHELAAQTDLLMQRVGKIQRPPGNLEAQLAILGYELAPLIENINANADELLAERFVNKYSSRISGEIKLIKAIFTDLPTIDTGIEKESPKAVYHRLQKSPETATEQDKEVARQCKTFIKVLLSKPETQKWATKLRVVNRANADLTANNLPQLRMTTRGISLG